MIGSIHQQTHLCLILFERILYRFSFLTNIVSLGYSCLFVWVLGAFDFKDIKHLIQVDEGLESLRGLISYLDISGICSDVSLLCLRGIDVFFL